MQIFFQTIWFQPLDRRSFESLILPSPVLWTIIDTGRPLGVCARPLIIIMPISSSWFARMRCPGWKFCMAWLISESVMSFSRVIRIFLLLPTSWTIIAPIVSELGSSSMLAPIKPKNNMPMMSCTA